MRKKVQKKLSFFELSNCFQANEQHRLATKWEELFPEKGGHLIVELGAGKATFTVQLASTHRENYYIAIDTKIDRLSYGAQLALQQQLNHVFFVQMHIEQIVLHIPQASIDEIWITFPDPYPKERHEKHRLTHPKFLAIYQRLLKPGAALHFKTDNHELFNYTLQTLKNVGWQTQIVTHDLYASEYQTPENTLKTEYEKKFLADGKKIAYLKLMNPEKPLDALPLLPTPVFSPLKFWKPTSDEIQKITAVFPTLDLASVEFHEYDLNQQFTRTNDFQHCYWILMEGEVALQMIVSKQEQSIMRFQEPLQIIDFQIDNKKIQGITLTRSRLIKVAKALKSL